MGFRGVEAQAEEDRGKDKTGKAYPQPIWVSEVWKLKLKKTEARTRPGGLILNQYGVSEVWKLKKTEARTRQGGGGLSSTNMGFRGVEAPAEEDRGRDKAGRAYPQPMWVSEVWKLKLKKTEAGTRPGGLVLNQCGFPRSGS